MTISSSISSSIVTAVIVDERATHPYPATEATEQGANAHHTCFRTHTSHTNHAMVGKIQLTKKGNYEKSYCDYRK
jgi:hypothetical protein